MSRKAQIVKRAGQVHRQEFVKLLKQATSTGHSLWNVWDDFIYMMASAISQVFVWKQEREDYYLRIIGKYEKKIQEIFPKMFAEIVMAFEEEGCKDILGGLYMELELFNHWKGQYFTPDHVCHLMATLTFNDVADLIEQNGYITVNDPTCGGGAMLIAFAKTCLEHNVDYQRDVLFVGQDIDPVVARMCYISMSLLGMPGYVIVGNTLTADFSHYDYWHTPMYFVHGFQARERLREFKDAVGELMKPQEDAESESVDILETENTVIQAPEDSYIVSVAYNENQVGQLTLF